MEEPVKFDFEIDESITLTELIDVSILQQMQDAFSKMARMAALTTDSDGVALTEGSNFSELCMGYCRKSDIGRERCENCDKMGAVMSLEQKKPISYRCHADLVDFAAPIMLGDRMIGSFIGGQVLPEDINEEKMRQVAREIEVDEEGFLEAARKTQIIPQAAIDRSTVFLYEFAKIMSDMAYNAYLSKQLSKEAMQAAIQKQDFLANMSHEIRTPMNAVLGMAEMALREPMSEEAKEYITQIQSAGKHLLVIINDILDYSKIDSGKMTVVDTIYETETLINDLASVVNSRIEGKDIEFLIDVPCDMPIELYGDYVRIHQILLNLLNNAVKFTHNGAIRLKLEYEPIEEEKVLFKASVIDTGNGIREEDLKKLFNSFQQVDSKRNRNVEGTGLGLAISKQLVELMGGSISVSSVFGKGSTFSVQFPQKVQTRGETPKQPDAQLDIYLYLNSRYLMEQVERDLAGVNCRLVNLNEEDVTDFADGSVVIMERVKNESLDEISARFANVTVIVIEAYDSANDNVPGNIKVLKKPEYSKKLLALLGLARAYSRDEVSDDDIFSFVAPEAKVLIVDDNSINLTVASGLLQPLNMQIDTATGAMECIDLIQQKKYDLIFMDHMMPGVDGIETTHIIRRMYTNYEDVPIVALTANATSDAQAAFLAEGMNDFVAKPIETKKIVAKVQQWLPDHLKLPVDMANRKIDDVSKEESIIDSINIPGLNVKEALSLLRSEKLYLNFLKEYYASIDTKAQKIQDAYDTKDIKTYTIEVHALKSSSRQIGADELSKDAATLEKAGNENDLATIDALTAKLLDDYKALKLQLSTIFDSGDGAEQKEKLDAQKAESYLEKILAAIDDFDFVLIEEIFDDVMKLELSDAEAEVIEKIRAASGEFDADAVTELAEELKQLY